MSIEIGKKYVNKDGEVVEVYSKGCILDGINSSIYCICFTSNKTTKDHVLTEHDFLEQYKPYEVVYEYQYAYYDAVSGVLITNNFYTDMEALLSVNDVNQRLDFTKRERK